MTTTFPCETIVAELGVYAPQEDSRLLVDMMCRTGVVEGRRVLDLCTGSGVLALAAAKLGAAEVTAFDICERAVRCAQANAGAAGVEIDVRQGSISDALAPGPFDLVVSNPPYVPVGPGSHNESIPQAVGTALAWDAGEDGRLVLDPLCSAAPKLLADGGTMLIVQSEVSGIEQSVSSLEDGGLDAEVIATQFIPFGPVLSARARWLTWAGRLHSNRNEEMLAVIRADKR